MLYDKCMIDVANLFYRMQNGVKQSATITKKMINFIEQEVKSHLKDDGTLYLLFDPISLSDLGENKNFHVSLNERKKILSDYKEGRVYSPLYYDSIELVRKYYIYRGEKVKLIYSDEYEADDYIEPLLEQNKTDNIALISSDMDWAKFIKDENGVKINLINRGFDNPYTVKEFEQIFQFKPTIAANTVYKALFGDKSDNIQGALFIKKAKFNINIKIVARDYIQSIANSAMTLDDVIKQFKTANFMQLNKKENKGPFDLLFLQMSIVDLKIPILEKFYTNIRVIKSLLSGRNIDDFIHCNKVQEKTNEIVHQSIFGVQFRTQFGKL